ncbi:myelin-oligodendrocyte glycoprotein-like isoform X1 [Astatotilapia calliptera]|uniref:myelin-oligodendrocyte glycoprotein-like isoform X1 n=1 Tax=Astatotilapia calliptera TaxID=8154 RepID=UPI000E41660C|nr:myelin-oligodendrocyte glycoprotein-like isoform X1 [Astatotilapia calliptera]
MFEKTLFLALTFALLHTGKLQTSSSTQKIEVSNGDDLPFPCEIPPRTNLKCPSLVLKRVDGNTGVIYTCRNGKEDLDSQPEQYRNRVKFINEDMRRGLMTVWIRSVQQSDSGKYKWFIPNSKYACFFDVVVTEKQNLTKENDTSTTATEEMPDTDPAPENSHHYYALIPVFALLIAPVFLMLFKNRICKTCQRKTEENDSELETQGNRAKKGDEEEQLKKPSARRTDGLKG